MPESNRKTRDNLDALDFPQLPVFFLKNLAAVVPFVRVFSRTESHELDSIPSEEELWKRRNHSFDSYFLAPAHRLKLFAYDEEYRRVRHGKRGRERRTEREKEIYRSPPHFS